MLNYEIDTNAKNLYVKVYFLKAVTDFRFEH